MEYLKTHNLSAFYGARQILHDIEIRLSKGEWVSIVGANGSGKTTLLKTLAGWDIQNKGEIEIFEQPTPFALRRSLISLVPNPSDLPEYLTGNELIKIIVREKQNVLNSDWRNIWEILDANAWLEKTISSLSWGTKKKLCLAIGLCVSPQFLFLDESFDGLDAAASFKTRQMLLQICKRDNIGILCASHSWESVFAYSDEVYFLQEGKIVKHLEKNSFDATKQQAINMEKIIIEAFSC